MNKNVFKRSVATLFIGVSVLTTPFALTAAPTPSSIADECTKELLLSYFPEPIVSETLKRFDVPQDKWAGINKSLAEKDKQVVKIVEQKAAAMTPNPLKDPQQRQAAVKLFRDTLLEVFTGALQDNGVTDTSKFQAMLDDIQQQKAKKFAMCMDKKRAELKAADAKDTSATDSEDDSDDDSDDESDDDSDDEDDADDSDAADDSSDSATKEAPAPSAS